jgi:hypothetical protein
VLYTRSITRCPTSPFPFPTYHPMAGHRVPSPSGIIHMLGHSSSRRGVGEQELYVGSPGRLEEIRVGGQRLLDHLLKSLLLLLGLFHPLLGHLLDGLLLLSC